MIVGETSSTGQEIGMKETSEITGTTVAMMDITTAVGMTIVIVEITHIAPEKSLDRAIEEAGVEVGATARIGVAADGAAVDPSRPRHLRRLHIRHILHLPPVLAVKARAIIAPPRRGKDYPCKTIGDSSETIVNRQEWLLL